MADSQETVFQALHKKKIPVKKFTVTQAKTPVKKKKKEKIVHVNFLCSPGHRNLIRSGHVTRIQIKLLPNQNYATIQIIHASYARDIYETSLHEHSLCLQFNWREALLKFVLLTNL